MTEITVKIDVFPSPEHCSDGIKTYCKELYRMDWIYWCHQFNKHGSDKFPIQEDKDFFNIPMKCERCKKVYQEDISS